MRKPRAATAVVAAAMVGALGFGVPAFAASGYGPVETDFDATAKTLTIGNDAFTRTFSWKDGQLTTTQIDNKLGKTKLTPGGGSEEFLIEGLVSPTRKEPGEGALTSVKPGKAQPQVQVTVKGSSEDAGEQAFDDKAIDGDSNSYWASNGKLTTDPEFEISFGKQVTIKSLVYTPRSASDHGYECTGQILKVKVQKKDGNKWTGVKEFTLKPGKEGCDKQQLTFDTPVTTESVKLVVTDSYHWDPSKKGNVANIAEIDALDANGASLVHPSAAPVSEWSIETSSDQGTNDGGGIAALIDGNTNTYWHSKYNNNGVTGEANKMPVTVTLDRGDSAPAFSTLGYMPRPNQMSNGNWTKFELYASDNKDDLYKPESQLVNQSGDKTFKVGYTGMYGQGAESGAKWNYFGLKENCSKRYVGVKVTEGHGGSFAAGSELDLFSGDPFTSCDFGKGARVKASELKLTGDPKVEDVTHDVNGVKKSGKLVTFAFEPFKFGTDPAATVEMKVVMYDGDHFMRKWLEFKTADKDARVKFIDGEHLKVAEDAKTWTAPRDKGGVVAMEMDKSVLGQPVYINGMFFGCEFPEADTQIMDEVARSRYWTGKNFADFKRDGQLTKDGEFVSWETVCGATHSDGSDMNVIQTDFYAYITSISKPSDFRIQYNSWFDNMMFIDDENIIESFKAVDKELSETGVRPLESYVVDDGWNQYRATTNQYTTGDDLRRNGSVDEPLGINTSGFWQFNNKFPDGLTPSSNLVHKLGSEFGVWIGPRGGYNYYGNLANIIAQAGNGSSAGGSIDVADQRYVDKFGDMAVDWMQKYGVNYWKWDGFADGGQYGAFTSGEDHAQYNEAHQHMEGGPHHFYHVTDLWEKWIVLFDRVWDTASAEQIEDLWVSLTCYVNPSPWFLQWSNSVWIQCTLDRGDVDNGLLHDKMNTMLTYRDACYYDFLKNHEFQFPLANLYNHDPVYGREGIGIKADSMNGEQFRNYLYMMGTRGTAFWELYYSDSLFNDEKYLVNADFLAWEESNFGMLRNAKMIGGTPSTAVHLGSISGAPGEQHTYGFAGFNNEGNEGIISMRNPGTTAMELKFTVDAGIGCTSEGTYHVVRDHVYTEKGQEAAEAPATVQYGQEVTITLQPGETQIWHLSKGGDTIAPTLSKLYTENNTTLRVQASEHVYGAQLEVLVNGKKVELGKDAVKAYADLKTFDITLPSAPADGATVEVKAVAGTDAAGNKLAGAIDRTFHTDAIVAQVANPVCPNLASKDASVTGANGFAVTASVDKAPAGTVLVSQGEEWKLGINAEGHAYFTVGGVTAVSEAKVEGSTSVTGVRENNGMLKVYVGGQIEGNGYDAKTSVGHEVKPAAIKVNTKAGVSTATVYDRSLGYDEVPAAPLAELVETVKALKGKVTEKSWADAKIDELLKAAEEALAGTDAAAQQAAYQALLDGYNKLVPGLGEPVQENLALGKTPTASWLPGKPGEGNVENSGSPLTNATDGKFDSDGTHAIFGVHNAQKPAYMQIDLGEGASIDSVKLWRYWSDRRSYADTALVVSNDPDFKEKEVLYYSYKDESNKDVFGLGQDATEQSYQETKDGKVLFTAGDKPIKARYVRLYGNGKTAEVGGDNHIVELQVMGTRTQTLGDPYGVSALDALITRAETALKNADKYEPESIEALKAPLATAKKLSKSIHEQIESQQFITTYGEFNAARDALQSALGCLELKVEKLYNVTFDDRLDETASLVISVPEGGVVTRPADPARDGWKFEGWFTDEACTKAYDFATPVTGDITLFAKWVKNADGNLPGGGDDHGQDNKPGNDNKPGKPDKPGSNSGLPQTGDNSLIMAGGIAAVAAVALGGGIYLKRRRS